MLLCDWLCRRFDALTTNAGPKMTRGEELLLQVCQGLGKHGYFLPETAPPLCISLSMVLQLSHINFNGAECSTRNEPMDRGGAISERKQPCFSKAEQGDGDIFRNHKPTTYHLTVQTTCELKGSSVRDMLKTRAQHRPDEWLQPRLTLMGGSATLPKPGPAV